VLFCYICFLLDKAYLYVCITYINNSALHEKKRWDVMHVRSVYVYIWIGANQWNALNALSMENQKKG
jgi:hypothetical protein